MTRWVAASALAQVLKQADYREVLDDTSNSLVLVSPKTGRPIVLPISGKGSLPEKLVYHLLRDEPLDVDQIIEAAFESEFGSEG